MNENTLPNGEKEDNYGFPCYKGWWIFKRPDGWRDLGKRKGFHRKENPPDVTTYVVHTFCGTRVKLGTENGELFKFCPRCLVVLNTEPND